MRWPPRREVSAGRGMVWRCITGTTVMHRRNTVLTRSILRGVVALACTSTMFVAASPAHAQSAQERLDQTRHAIDDAAQRYFNAQNNAASVNTRIQALEHDMNSAAKRVANAKKIATQRALLMYETASTEYATVFGSTPLDSARRVQLVDHANARNFAAIDELKASMDHLRTQRKALALERGEQERAVRAASLQRAALDTSLTSLRAEARREAATAANAAVARRRTAVRSTSTSTRAPDGSSTTTPPAPSNDTTAPLPSAPPPSPPSTGVSAHHNDPFLVCTRARESGGNYAVVSADGYYGAYQFLPSTWDAIASHAGRLDLVGVLPSRASEYDQDELAWALLQWQGKAPWGGRC